MAKQSGGGSRRKEQYDKAKKAGFTPAQASKLRDASKVDFNKAMQSKQLPAPVPQGQRGAVGRGGRKQKWGRWSQGNREDRFPDWINDAAEEINTQNNLPEGDHYGWRAMYNHYVNEGMQESDIDDMDEENIDFADSYEELAAA